MNKIGTYGNLTYNNMNTVSSMKNVEKLIDKKTEISKEKVSNNSIVTKPTKDEVTNKIVNDAFDEALSGYSEDERIMIMIQFANAQDGLRFSGKISNTIPSPNYGDGFSFIDTLNQISSCVNLNGAIDMNGNDWSKELLDVCNKLKNNLTKYGLS